MSIQVEVQQRGLDIKILADEIPSEILPGLVKKAADFAYASMLSRAPVRSGRLLGSIREEISGLEATVGPSVLYALYVEYGTSPHVITPVFSRVLRFEVEGKVIFTPIVRHPGTKPQPFIRETASAVRERIPKLWEEVAGEEIR
jgi:HK97 gp10 family phage protein